MSILKDETVIRIESTESSVILMFLQIFLSKERLTGKQLSITTELVAKYAEYVKNGVKEPYASSLLFSTETRKEIYTKLGMSAAHFTNTLGPLVDKGILAVEENGKYLINPNILPCKKLIFNFIINAG